MFTGKEIMKYIDSFFLWLFLKLFFFRVILKLHFYRRKICSFPFLNERRSALSICYRYSHIHRPSRSFTQSHAVSHTSVYIQYVPNSIRGYFRIWCEQELVIKLYMILLFWLSRLKFEQENSISFEMALCE